jgi:hypothetical protein
VRDEQNRREAEARVHQRSILAKRGSQKRRMQSEQYASACTCRYLDFVSLEWRSMDCAVDRIQDTSV